VWLVDKASHGKWQTGTLITSLGVEGVRYSAAAHGPVKAKAFEACTAQILVP
jgi:hypothetical protein